MSTTLHTERNRSSFEARVVREGVAAAEADLAIQLQGEIDGRAEATLQDAYTEAAQRDPRRLLLDFAEVDYINSTGIALIVGLLARARKERREIVARGLSAHYREIFEITRLADFMSIV